MLSSFLGGKSKETVSVKLTARNGVTFSGQITKDSTVAELCQALDPALRLPERQFFGLKPMAATNAEHVPWLEDDTVLRKALGAPATVMDSKDGSQSLKEWHLLLALKFYPTKAIAKHWSPQGARLLMFELLNDLKLGCLEVAHDTAVALGAFAAQVIHGDYQHAQHQDLMYLRNVKVTPYQDASLSERIRDRHSQMHGMVTSADALASFLQLCQEQELYGVGQLIKAKSDALPQTLHIGASARGIHVYDHDRRIIIHPWPALKRIFHRGKHFELTLKSPGRASDPVNFVMSTAAECKRCWLKAVQCHSFYRYRTANANSTGPTMLEAARTARQASQELLSVETERLRRRSTFGSSGSKPTLQEALASADAGSPASYAAAVAQYDAKSDAEGLTFAHGDIIRVTDHSDFDYWWGAIGTRVGRFPSRCVTLLGPDLSKVVKATRDYDGALTFAKGAILTLEDAPSDLPPGLVLAKSGSRVALIPDTCVQPFA
eukprot:m.109878 g.109878  ORF g.109878 m.109878 type:complete len:491 (+) comp15354_c0_seq36:91-1563(+)